MTARAPGLTSHFVRAIVSPPLVTELGADFLRRTLSSVLAILLVAGIFLSRALFKKYVDLYAAWDENAYRRAVEADSLMMIAVPMVVVGLVAIVLAPLLFPDEIDYRTLAPLPISRFRIFAAKLAAVAVVASGAVFAVNAVASFWFPAAIGGRWMPHGLLARTAAHGAASVAGSLWMFSAVMAVQGLCLAAAPGKWRRPIGLVAHALVFVTLLLCVPYVIRIPTMHISNELVVETPLVWVPAVWFLGVERWLLDPSELGYVQVARFAGLSGVVTIAIVFLTYARLYQTSERLAITPPAAPRTPLAVLAPLEPVWQRMAAPTRAVWAFALRGLSRSRLHQTIFVLVVGAGFAILAGQLLTAREGMTFLGSRPRRGVPVAIAAPLLIALATTLALRAAFLFPLDQGAAWVFRLTETPSTRPRLLDAVTGCLRVGAVVPALLVGALLQPPVLGARWVWGAAITALASLVLVEIVLRDWCRVPFTCTYLPGKRVLAYTLGVLFAAYFIFVSIGARLVAWSMASGRNAVLFGAFLLMLFVVLRHSRLRTWGRPPLQFEDEDPLTIRTLNLLPDERH